MGIKYTKLPDTLDVDKLIRQKVKEVYGYCPYCASRRTVSRFCDVDGDTYDFDTKRMTLDGRGYNDYNGDEMFSWARAEFRCRRCGGKWESDYYPIRLSTSPNFIKRLMDMNLTGKNATMIVIKRDVERMIGGRARIGVKNK